MTRMRALMRATAVACALSAPANADPVQERIDQITEEMTQLSLSALSGEVNGDVATQRMEELMELEAALRTGQVTPDDLTLRWQIAGDAPLKAPGARLIATGLPAGFDAPVWGLMDDGRRINLVVEAAAEGPDEVEVFVPDHPDGPEASGTLRVMFEGAGSLTVDIAPRLDVPNALPTLMRMAMQDLVAALERNGADPEALVAQFRTDASTVPPELGYAAATLFLWSEAGRGHPVFGFLRTGVPEGPFWDSIGPPDPGGLNRIYANVLQNSGTLDRLMRVNQERIDKINFVPPLPIRSPLQKAKVPQATPPQDVSMDELSALLTEGRARQYNREVVLQSAKDAQKLYGYAAFEPVTMTSAALVGGVLTMADKYLKAEDFNFPVKMSLEGGAVPGDPLLADDERRVFPDLTVVAKGEPYDVKVFSDGLDAALAVVDIVTSVSAVGKGLKTLGQPAQILTKSQRARQRIQASMDNAKDFLVKQTSGLTKDALEATEKAGDTRQQGTFSVVTIPAREWRAKIDQRSYRNHVSVGYRGEVAWDVRQYHAYACWKDTQEGITGTVTTKPDAFAGLFDRLDMGWSVRDPKITLSAEPARIRPGETALITATASGARAPNVIFAPPPLGGLGNIGNLDATFSAPAELDTCKELVPITATYPPPGARICAPPPTATAGVIIAKGDALIGTPQTLTCRDGEVLGFTVAHPDGVDVQCQLNGPGRLKMVGNEGLLDCPVKPRQSSSITCHTGRRPGECAPVIPIKRIYPDYSVYAQVSADRPGGDKLNDYVPPMFDDCGLENTTSLMLELMDLGTGAADVLPVDPITNPCASDTSLGGGGGVSGSSGGGSPTVPDTPAEGRYVAVWPLGEGRDVEVSDSFVYRHSPYDPGRGPGDRSVRVESDIEASVTFDGPERFIVRTYGQTAATSIRAASETPSPSGGSAEWSVWRRIVVTRDTLVTADISVDGPATKLVTAAPMRLENNVPISLLTGFDQNATSVMLVGTTGAVGLGVSPSSTSTALLPGPRGNRDSITYLIRFGGSVTPAESGEDTVTAASVTTVDIDIRPAR